MPRPEVPTIDQPPVSTAPAGPTAAADPAGLPRVVLVGRPNAGKSTLFNRLLRRRKAVVDPTPGVTRDPNEAAATWDGRAVTLVDTGGFDASATAGLDRSVRERGMAAIAGAALVVYVLDGKAGLSPADEAAARTLRRRGVPMLFVVNKLDSARRESQAPEFHRLGADELLGISAEHGHGIDALVAAILARVEAGPADTAVRSTRVGVIGRPNVGKSSLVNRLLGYPRALVADTAGTTRDAVDSMLEVGGTRYVLVDTAGIRRRSRIQERVERAAAGKALETLGRSEVVLLVVDAGEGITTQDRRLAGLAWQEGRGLVLVANKADLLADPSAAVAGIRRALPALGAVPVLATSTVTGAGIDGIWPAVRMVAAAHDAVLKTSRLNDVVAAAVQAKEPPLIGGRRPRIYYATQVGRRPPTIAVFASRPADVHPSYTRYLQNQIAAAFHLPGTPVRVQFRARR